MDSVKKAGVAVGRYGIQVFDLFVEILGVLEERFEIHRFHQH